MRMQIKRLILVADIQLLHDQPLADHQNPNIDKFQACALVVDSLRRSNADWTLVSAPQGVAGLSIEHFSQTGWTLEPGLQIPLEVLGRVAAGIADELRLNAHVRQ